jgi:hypothetical protein
LTLAFGLLLFLSFLSCVFSFFFAERVRDHERLTPARMATAEGERRRGREDCGHGLAAATNWRCSGDVIWDTDARKLHGRLATAAAVLGSGDEMLTASG